MIESKCIGGAAISVFDPLVTQVLEDYPLEGGGKDMEIAIQHLNGEIYAS